MKIKDILKMVPYIEAEAMARTETNDPLKKNRFRISISGLPVGIGFSKVSGLSREIEVVEYFEGMLANSLKLQGKEKNGELTMERGTYASSELEDLYKTALAGGERKTLIIEIMNKSGTAAMKTYKLAEAWVSKWEASDLDASSSDVAIEKITVQYESCLD